jgi:hypothetical protein
LAGASTSNPNAGRLDELPDRRAFHLRIEPAGLLQDRVANLLSVEPADVHPPEQRVRLIEGGRLGTMRRRLPISRAGDEQPVEPLQRSAVPLELAREPVEQFRVSG